MRFFGMTAMLCAVLALAGCVGDYSWRQKLTIVVETPDGEVSGSAVTQVGWRKNHFFKDGGPYYIDVSGEAAFVNLGQGRYVFATISPEHHARLAAEHRSENNGKTKYPYASPEAAQNLAITLKLAVDRYPRLVTFDDISDPKTVRAVTVENFSALFGEGYSLKQLTLNVVDEPITDGTIEPVLKWWREYRYSVKGKYSKRLNGRTGSMGSSRHLSNLLGPGSFKLGLE